MEDQNEHKNSSGEVELWFDNISDGIIGEKFFSITQEDYSAIQEYNPKIQENSSMEQKSAMICKTKKSEIHKKIDPTYFPLTSLPILLLPAAPSFKILPIHENEDEYLDIKRRITSPIIKIHSIDKIDNALLECSYLFKKMQKLKYYSCLEELELFHGTKWRNADSICKNNFNWRFYGKEVCHKYGKGVCFTSDAMYAAHYSDTNKDEKVMFIAKVLIGERSMGLKHQKLPPDGFDTSVKDEKEDIVVVKYEDNEYYPKYRIKYHLIMS